MRRRIIPILLLLAASLAWSAPALGRGPDLYQQMIIDVIKNGRLDACKYSQDKLKAAKNATPVDGNQYSGSFIAALDDAIAARAQGACNTSKKADTPAVAPQTAAPGAPPPPAGGGQTGTPSSATAAPATPGQAQAPPTPNAEPTAAPAIVRDDSIALASGTTDVATDAPFPVLALAILAGLLALSALALALARWFAWEPAWSVRMRHAAGEAGWRASSTWAEFSDFVRLGR